VQLGFSSNRVMTDKKSSKILIDWNHDTNIYSEKVGVDYLLKSLIKCKILFERVFGELSQHFAFKFATK
jgi:hypothetical protein